MGQDELWALEEELWTGGETPWKATLHRENVMAFPDPTGVISGDAVIYQSIIDNRTQDSSTVFFKRE